jgi:hypothetical protein
MDGARNGPALPKHGLSRRSGTRWADPYAAVEMTRVRMALRDAFKVNAGNAAHPRHVISNVESQRDVAVICREE